MSDTEKKRDIPKLLAARRLRWGGEYAEALLLARKALKELPGNDEVFKEFGSIYLAMDDSKTALKWFMKAHELNQADVEVIREIARCYANLDETKMSERWYDKALEIAPDDWQALFHSGLGNIRNGSIAKGIKYLKRYLQLEKWEDKYNLLKVISNWALESDSDSDEKEKALFLNFLWEAWAITAKAEYGYLCADTFRRAGRLDDALAIMKVLVAREPSVLHFNLYGVVLFQLGQYEQAIDMYRHAIEKSQVERGQGTEEQRREQTANHAVYHSNLSGAYLAVGNTSEALLEAEKALKLDDAAVYHWRSKLDALKKQSDLKAPLVQTYVDMFTRHTQKQFLSPGEKQEFWLEYCNLLDSYVDDFMNEHFQPAIAEIKNDQTLYQAYRMFHNYQRRESIILVQDALKKTDEENNAQRTGLTAYQENVQQFMNLVNNVLEVSLQGVQQFPEKMEFYEKSIESYVSLEQYDRAGQLMETLLETLASKNQLNEHSYWIGHYSLVLLVSGQENKARDVVQKYRDALIHSNENAHRFASSARLFDDPYLDQEKWFGYFEVAFRLMPEEIDSLEWEYQIRLSQNRIAECVATLQHILQHSLHRDYRTAILNNAGYLNLLQHNFADAWHAFLQADAIEPEPYDYENEAGSHDMGVCFFLEGRLAPCDWFIPEEVSTGQPGFWPIRNPKLGVLCNLASVALSQGRTADAASIITCILFEQKYEDADRPLILLMQLALAIYRNEQASARIIWKQYCELNQKKTSVEIFQQKHPALYAWLAPAPVSNG